VFFIFSQFCSIAAVASLRRQISTKLVTILYRTIKCVAYRQAGGDALPKRIRTRRNVGNTILRKQGFFARNLDRYHILEIFSPKNKESLLGMIIKFVWVIGTLATNQTSKNKTLLDRSSIGFYQQHPCIK